jgi:hypothetical protein
MNKKLIIIGIIIYMLLMTIVINSTQLRLLTVSSNEKRDFTKDIIVFSQVDTKFQESNCFYAVATSIINDLNDKNYLVDDLRDKYDSDGVDIFGAYKILQKENIDANLYIGSKNSKIWMKLLNECEYIILSTGISQDK